MKAFDLTKFKAALAYIPLPIGVDGLPISVDTLVREAATVAFPTVDLTQASLLLLKEEPSGAPEYLAILAIIESAIAVDYDPEMLFFIIDGLDVIDRHRKTMFRLFPTEEAAQHYLTTQGFPTQDLSTIPLETPNEDAYMMTAFGLQRVNFKARQAELKQLLATPSTQATAPSALPHAPSAPDDTKTSENPRKTPLSGQGQSAPTQNILARLDRLQEQMAEYYNHRRDDHGGIRVIKKQQIEDSLISLRHLLRFASTKGDAIQQSPLDMPRILSRMMRLRHPPSPFHSAFTYDVSRNYRNIYHFNQLMSSVCQGSGEVILSKLFLDYAQFTYKYLGSFEKEQGLMSLPETHYIPIDCMLAQDATFCPVPFSSLQSLDSKTLAQYFIDRVHQFQDEDGDIVLNPSDNMPVHNPEAAVTAWEEREKGSVDRLGALCQHLATQAEEGSYLIPENPYENWVEDSIERLRKYHQIAIEGVWLRSRVLPGQFGKNKDGFKTDWVRSGIASPSIEGLKDIEAWVAKQCRDLSEEDHSSPPIRLTAQKSAYLQLEIRTSPEEIVSQLTTIFIRYQTDIQDTHTLDGKLIIIATFVHQLALTHPFGDGNLRVVGQILNQLLDQQGLSPCLLAEPAMIEYLSPKELAMVIKSSIENNDFSRLVFPLLSEKIQAQYEARKPPADKTRAAAAPVVAADKASQGSSASPTHTSTTSDWKTTTTIKLSPTASCFKTTSPSIPPRAPAETAKKETAKKDSSRSSRAP